MPECVGVRFDNGPKIHYFESPPTAPEVGTRCVVSTRRGLELGEVRTTPRDRKGAAGHYVRRALRDDVERYQALRAKADELKWLLRARARQHGARMKLVSLEFNLDETVLIVNYSAEAQVPLRVLTQELLRHTAARIEFLNVGPRDQARIMGTLGSCGMGSCSSTWLQSFNAVSIRMARDQQLPLNPEKISGPCGRLMCCLQYEHEMYQELLAGMPKKGSHACNKATGVCGRISKLNPLKDSVELETEGGKVEEVMVGDLERVSRRS